MTPKEKAEELINKFNKIILCENLTISETLNYCALIAIDEMLDFRNSLYLNEESLAHQYLLEIKQEIEKL